MIQPRGTTRASRPRAPLRAGALTEDQLHELRNHVHGIVMAVQLALDVQAETPWRHRRNLHQIEVRCRQLAAFTRLLQPSDALPKPRS